MPKPEESSAENSTPLQSQCPKCGNPMEAGFLRYDRSRTSWQQTRPEHWWQEKPGDHLGPRSLEVTVYAPASRCNECRIVTFEYAPG